MPESDSKPTLLMDAASMAEAIKGIANSIRNEFPGNAVANIAFIGIQRHGVLLAQRIIENIKKETGVEPLFGSLDITMYRDDIGMRKTLPEIHETTIPFEMERRTIILVDDVLQTGRTIRAALDALTDYGRPALIRLAVLVDRGLREFPIGADYVGAIQRVPPTERVTVKWREADGEDAVLAVARKTPTQA